MLLGLLWSPFCFAVIALASLSFGYTLTDSTILIIPPMMFMLVISLSTWYLCKIRPIGGKRLVMTFVIHFFSAAIINLIWLFLMFLYSVLLDKTTKSEVWEFRFVEALPLWASVGITIYFLATMFHYLVIALENARQAEREVLEERLLASQAELRALKSSIHPHFLFNSLAALSAIITRKPKEAAEISKKLSAFFQYSLRHGKNEIVSLGEEVKHIESYLAIEQMRLGKRLKIKLHVEKGLKDCRILSLVLLPLVENSIKHGISESVEGGTLAIDISDVNGKIRIEITNPYDPISKARVGEGLGLRTLRERLRMQYGNRASVHDSGDGKIYTVIIDLPCGQGINK
jgi:sensor histidine kinase YesM